MDVTISESTFRTVVFSSTARIGTCIIGCTTVSGYSTAPSGPQQNSPVTPPSMAFPPPAVSMLPKKAPNKSPITAPPIVAITDWTAQLVCEQRAPGVPLAPAHARPGTSDSDRCAAAPERRRRVCC